jgi:hypothetical protein
MPADWHEPAGAQTPWLHVSPLQQSPSTPQRAPLAAQASHLTSSEWQMPWQHVAPGVQPRPCGTHAQASPVQAPPSSGGGGGGGAPASAG